MSLNRLYVLKIRYFAYVRTILNRLYVHKYIGTNSTNELRQTADYPVMKDLSVASKVTMFTLNLSMHTVTNKTLPLPLYCFSSSACFLSLSLSLSLCVCACWGGGGAFIVMCLCKSML